MDGTKIQAQRLNAFRLGDVRGIYPKEINESFAFDFGCAFCQRFSITGTIATGRDSRISSQPLQEALNRGLLECGINVIDIGLCATELGYFTSAQAGIDAVIIVTASHNPAKYNGFKCVLKHGEAVSFNSGLSDVMQLMLSGNHNKPATSRDVVQGELCQRNYQTDYLDYLGQYFQTDDFQITEQLPVALNGLNGTAATLAGDLADKFSIPATWFRKEPGPIPAQGADPVNPELVKQMAGFMQQDKFALGIAWDGDCDRCVFFDSDGKLIPTYYIIGLLSEAYLTCHPQANIVFDAKLRWNTLDIITEHGGHGITAATGHAFMKTSMKQNQAVYGGELSSHHYFGDFFHCDSGMFAWLKVLQIISSKGLNLTDVIEQRRKMFCSTPEINLQVSSVATAYELIQQQYRSTTINYDEFDGMSFEMPGDWRFSLCESKTEPLLRLNLESRGDQTKLLSEGAKLLTILQPLQTDNSDWFSKLVIQ